MDNVVDSNTESVNENINTKALESNLSKRQLKKLRKKIDYEAKKKERRLLQKQRRKLKKQQEGKKVGRKGPSQYIKLSDTNCKIRIALDFSFDHLMGFREITKCVQQLGRCYSANRRSQSPMLLHVVSLSGKSKEELSKHDGYQNWDIFIHSEPYLELFPKESLIYLTSESTNVLDKLEDDKIYIIGGLVDHNSQKGLCLKIAQDQGIAHAQLPIREHIDMKTRKVLAINHVYEILLHVSEGKSWKDAFLQVIPQRKGAEEKYDLQENV